MKTASRPSVEQSLAVLCVTALRAPEEKRADYRVPLFLGLLTLLRPDGGHFLRRDDSLRRSDAEAVVALGTRLVRPVPAGRAPIA